MSYTAQVIGWLALCIAGFLIVMAGTHHIIRAVRRRRQTDDR